MELESRTVTEKRRAANQAAAQKSTGPRTPQGKRRSAFNSFQHGARASQHHILRQALARCEYDPAAFDAGRQELLDDWQPAGAQQTLLVNDLAWLGWQRDQTRLALLEGQARRLPLAQLRRDQRRFQARHRDPAVNSGWQYESGYVALPASEAKFAALAQCYDDLADCAAHGRWEDRAPGGNGYRPGVILRSLYDKFPSTARGEKLDHLWRECAEEKPGADDPRVQQILALIAEERAALAEEIPLFRRQQEIDLEDPLDPDSPGLYPLGELWQNIAHQLQQLDRQIDAKIRLLLRLQQRAAQKARSKDPAGPAADAASLDQGDHRESDPGPSDAPAATGDPSPLAPVEPESAPTPSDAPAASVAAADTEIYRTKPNDPLESTKAPSFRAASWEPQDRPGTQLAPSGQRQWQDRKGFEAGKLVPTNPTAPSEPGTLQ